MVGRFKILCAAAIISVVLLSFFGLVGMAQAQAMTWTDTGHVGSSPVLSFAWNGTDTLYAGGMDGHVYSKTGPGTWVDTGDTGGGGVRALAWNGTDTLYAGGDDGHVYAKTGSGAWSDTGGPEGDYIRALAWDGTDMLYAGGMNGHVYSKTGSGPWIDTGKPGGDYILALAWNGTDTLYAGGMNGHVYSKTGSGPWIDTGKPGGDIIRALAWDGTDTLYAGGLDGHIYSKIGSGAWGDTGAPGGGRIYALAWDGTDTLYAGGDGGHVYSKIGSGAWGDTGDTGGSNIFALAWDGTDALYAGGINGHVFSKTGSGAWDDTGALGSGWIYALAWDGRGTVYAGGLDGHIYSKIGSEPWYDTGYTGSNFISALAWDGRDTLYAGGDDGHVYAKTGSGAWSDTGGPEGDYILALAWDGTDTLYAGGENGHVYAKTGSGSWIDTGKPGGDCIRALAWDGRGTLYAGSDGGHVYSKTGEANWIDTGKPGDDYILALAWDGRGTLYAGSDGGHVYSKTGSGSWIDTGGPEVDYIRALALDGRGTLYAGCDQGVFAGQYPAPTITSITPDRGDNSGTVNITNLAGANFLSGAEVKLTRSGQKEIKATNVNVKSARKITCRLNLKGAAPGPWDVYVENPEGQSVTKSKAFTVHAASPPPPPPPTPPHTWYLPEGTTAWGFSTYISIQNPDAAPVQAKATLMPTGSDNVTEVLALPANSQTTLTNDYLVSKLGNKDFSTKVEATDRSRPIAVDRTMEWTGPGAASPEGHSSIGVTSPAKTWYLPEGSTEWGFETWLLIQNPQGKDASCKVTYMIEGRGPQTIEHRVPARSRASFSMAEDIGQADASTKVESDREVIPERAMYRNDRREGHDSIGTTTPASTFYLAEGATGYDSGYITYVLVQNPHNSANEVNITYQTPSGEVPGPSFTMEPNSRRTVRVNDTLPPNTDVSTVVQGTKPVIAERAMYWDSPAGEACHDSIGLSSPHDAFMLPDGQTSNGRETWTLIQNPGKIPVEIRVSYLPAGGGKPLSFTDVLASGTRKTYNMAEKGVEGRAAVLVESIMGGPVIVERAMYWDSRGAGTDTVGGQMPSRRRF